MNEESNLKFRGPDRRKGEDRRQVPTDSSELPFPDRRKGDRREKDRRVLSESEREELLKKIKDEGGED